MQVLGGGTPAAGGAAPTHLFAGLLNSDIPNAAVPGVGTPGATAPNAGVPGAAPGAILSGLGVNIPGLGGGPLQGVVGQIINGVNTFEALRWYIGGWPSPGPLTKLGIGGPNVQYDAAGFGLGGLFWQRQIAGPSGPITVASFKRDVVAEVSGGLNVVESGEPAQLWFRSGDISSSKIAGLANQIGYMTARSVSRGNANFLHRLTTQLGVPPDQALETAQKLLDAKLVSPIGGRYELQSSPGTFPTWAVAGQAAGGGGLLPTPPPGFLSPPLEWFRGADLIAGSDATGLWAHGQIAMQQPQPTAAIAGQTPPASAEPIAAPRAKPPAPPAPSAIPTRPPTPPPQKSGAVPPPPIPSPPAPGPK